ncbi:MAG: Flp pilus assembly complex ATPase component [Comamonadaceae bacterium]|nr:Flp pilus assembly complex ATPase component [Comamonadaceae bacterium]
MRLGELLIERGLLDAAGLAQALQQQSSSAAGQRLGSILVRLGLVSEPSLYAALSQQLGLPLWDAKEQPERLEQALMPAAAASQLPAALARRWNAFTVPVEGALLLIARDPLLPELQEFAQGLAGARPLQPWLAQSADMARALAQIHNAAAPAAAASNDLRQLAQDAPIVEFVATMLSRGTDQHASDIHIEPAEGSFHVRYRVDGQLRATETHARERFDAVVSRIKLVSGLDIAERRLPQDGRFSTRAAGIETEVRVSVIPSVHGESVVMRLLPKTAHRRFRLDALGFEPDHLAALQTSLAEPDGIILVTGPTGSGKSTTLYAALAATDTAATRVLTVEDPVEYQLPGITQFQVQSDIGFTFPAALRAILRHDPDTVMIGEIRDPETAGIAIQASLTGHKVLSTLHTNDAPSAFVRLIDIGVEPFLLAASVRTVIAQRLIRRLCPHCATPLAPANLPANVRSQAEALGLAAADYAGREPQGCAECDDTGYRGRTGVHEVLAVTPGLRAALSGGRISDHEVRRHAQPGFRNLSQDALLRFWRGQTSLAEVLALASSQAELHESA